MVCAVFSIHGVSLEFSPDRFTAVRDTSKNLCKTGASRHEGMNNAEILILQESQIREINTYKSMQSQFYSLSDSMRRDGSKNESVFIQRIILVKTHIAFLSGGLVS